MRCGCIRRPLAAIQASIQQPSHPSEAASSGGKATFQRATTKSNTLICVVILTRDIARFNGRKSAQKCAFQRHPRSLSHLSLQYLLRCPDCCHYLLIRYRARMEGEGEGEASERLRSLNEAIIEQAAERSQVIRSKMHKLPMKPSP